MKIEGLKINISRLNGDKTSKRESSRVRLTQTGEFKSAFYISMIIFSVMAAVACVLITQVVRF